MYLTSTGIVQAYLTRTGRQLLADNSAQFNITGFRFSDDDINYLQFDGSTEDAPNADIMNTPILETTTFDVIPAQWNEIFSANAGNLGVAYLDVDINRPFTEGKQLERPFRQEVNLWIRYTPPANINQAAIDQILKTTFQIKTLYGYDDAYVIAPTTNIVIPLNPRVTGVPDTDPYMVRHRQSKGEVKLAVNVRNSTQVSVDPASIPAERPTDLDLEPLITWVQARGSAAVDSESTKQRISPRADVRDDTANEKQLIPTFGQLKIAYSSIMILGMTSKKTFKVHVYVYNPKGK